MRRLGFTLLELLIVVAIIAVLIALALPFYQDYISRAKITAAAADISSYKKALMTYDQLEATVFTGSDARLLIGKYMQDFRVNATDQQRPFDPWFTEYQFISSFGIILSAGPNRLTDTTIFVNRLASGDDVVATWKAPFVINAAKNTNLTTVEVEFSRRVTDSTVAFANVNIGALIAISKQKLSDTLYRFTFPPATPLTANTVYAVFISGVAAQDERLSFDNRADGTFGGMATFTAF